MDFDTLFTLALIAIYLIFQVLGAKKKQQKRKSAPLPEVPSPESGRSNEEPSLDDALREIRLALGMNTPAEASTPPPLPPSANTLSKTPKSKTYEPEFHAYPTEFADADFESQPTAFGKLPTIHKPSTKPLVKKQERKPRIKVAVPKPDSGAVKEPGNLTSGKALRKRLQDPKAALEAFILGEVLGPPRSHWKR